MNSSVVESQKQSVTVGTELGRLVCVEKEVVRVPDYYWHSGYFSRFRASLGTSFVCDNKRVVDEEYCPRTTRLHPSQIVQVALFSATSDILFKDAISLFREARADFVGLPGILLIHQSELWQRMPHDSWLVAPVLTPRHRSTIESDPLIPAIRRVLEEVQEEEPDPSSNEDEVKMVEVTHLGLLHAREHLAAGTHFPMFQILTGRR